MKFVYATLALAFIAPHCLAAHFNDDSMVISQNYDVENYSLVISQAQEFLKKNSHNDRVRFQMASSLFLSGKSIAALAEIENIQDPQLQIPCAILKGDALLQLKKFTEAQAHWKAFKPKGDDLAAIRAHRLALSQEGIGDFASASKSWAQVLEYEVRPSRETLQRLSNSFVMSSRLEEGHSFCKKSAYLGMQPGYRKACEVILYRAEGNTPKASIPLKRAASIMNEDKYLESLLAD